MKRTALPAPSADIISSDDHALSIDRREVIGNTVSLPGRFPIFTDGNMNELMAEYAFLDQDVEDERELDQIAMRFARFLKETRKQLKRDGRNLNDWKYTVMLAVHHKGQATDFWIGDRPDVARVDQSLEEHLKKPENAERVKITKS